MRRCSSLALFDSAVLPVVIMQAAKLQPGVCDSAHQADNCRAVTLLDPRAIHSWINIEKHPDAAASPLQNLFFVLSQNRNARLRKCFGDFPHAARVRA